MDQQTAFNLMINGDNIFLTGMAGTGKSYLLNKYIKYCKDNDIKVAVTASTGIAASHLNGRTIHSWSGMGIKSEEELELTRGYSPYTQERLRNTDVLIIDEISMLHAYQLNYIDKICRKILEDNEPFGGLRVIVCGDFLQLPPVMSKSRVGSKNGELQYAFESTAWDDADFTICYLTDIYRQEDPLFIEILNSLRQAKYNREHFHTLRRLINRQIPIDKPIELYPKNMDVDFVNNKLLSELKGEEVRYRMIGSGDPVFIDMLKRNMITPEILRLKVGAIVILTKNDPGGDFVNGTFGEIVELGIRPKIKLITGKTISVEMMNWEFVEFDFRSGQFETRATIKQYPLKLAFAITTHKSQGCTLDCAKMSLSNLFDSNMGYVALSRVKSLQYVTLTSLDMSLYKSNSYLLDKDKYFLEESKNFIYNLQTV